MATLSLVNPGDGGWPETSTTYIFRAEKAVTFRDRERVAELEITIQLGPHNYEVDVSHPIDMSIPVRFDGHAPSLFHALPSTSRPYQASGFVGSVARGGSCNCDIHTLIPHTAGTHTECVGHISSSSISIYDTLQDALLPATLVTLQPELSATTTESYPVPLNPSDLLLTRKSLEHALDQAQTHFLDALVIRTLPNLSNKRSRDYDTTGAPFFSTEAMNFLVGLGVRHLLVDLPSVDRLNDEGCLTNHRIFWNVPEGSHLVAKQTASLKTITELIYAPDAIADGHYLLNLQLAPFIADASPSRPTLYRVRSI